MAGGTVIIMLGGKPEGKLTEMPEGLNPAQKRRHKARVKLLNKSAGRKGNKLKERILAEGRKDLAGKVKGKSLAVALLKKRPKEEEEEEEV